MSQLPPSPGSDIVPMAATEMELEKEKEDVSEEEAFKSEKSEPEEVTETAPNPMAGLPPPDVGMKAWLACLGAFCGIYASFGYINVVGMFEAFYLNNQLKEYSASTISWITSLQIFLLVAGGLLFGPIAERYGPRWLAGVGTCFVVLGVFTTSASTKYWHFLLAQGICTSLGNSMLYYASLLGVSTWFKAKRGFTLGIAVAGSSIGGLTMPFMFSELEPRIGFPWTVRAIGFVLLGMSLICTVTISSRIPANPKLPLLDIKKDLIAPYRNVHIWLLTAGIFMTFWGLFVPIGYMSVQGQTNGMSPRVSFYLISIYNGCSVIGRILPGIVADHVGGFNMHAFCTILCSIFIFALWIPARTNPPIIAFSAVFGIISGSSISLFPALVGMVTPVAEVGRRLGMVSFFVAFACLTCMPIAGQILLKDKGSFDGCQAWAGVFMFCGGVTIFITKLTIPGKTWKSRF